MPGNQLSETSELEELIRKYSPFLKEIKKRFLFALIVFAIAAIFGFVFYDKIIKFFIVILGLRNVNIVFTSPFQFINLAVSCGLATGIVTVFPLLIYQILSFLKPALKVKEFKMIVRFLPLSLFLFVLGFLFGTLIMKWQIEIFLDKSVSLGIGNILDINRLISTVLMVSTLMGIAFQFPIILFLLMRIGLISHHNLSKQRLWVYIGSFFFAMLLPPDSIIADIFLAMPLVILFELTLILNNIFVKKTISS